MDFRAGHLVAGKRVSIAGAGLGGLAFGLSLLRLCKEQNISAPVVRLFERDAGAETRAAGYSMGISGGGLQVLHRLGVLDALLPLKEPGEGSSCTPGYRILASFKNAAAHDGMPVGGLRIGRSNLRKTLLQRLPEGSISYGKTCVSAMPGIDGAPVNLTFQDGTKEECDILVAADGVRSKLRSSLLPNEQPQYSGITMLAGRTDRLNALPELVSRGQLLTVSPSAVSSFIGPLEQQCAHWAFTWRDAQSRADELNALLKDPATTQQVAAFAEEKGREFAAGPWPELWKQTSIDAVWASALFEKLPHGSAQTAPIIFIGDSCHPMTPLAGNGANMAFCDAMQLSQQLTDPRHSTVQEAAAAYDKEMMPRASAAVQGGIRNKSFIFNQGWRRLLFLSAVALIGSIVRTKAVSLTAWQRLLGR